MMIMISAAALSLAVQDAAADTSTIDEARAYMAAYSELDLEAMRDWLNEETVFVDETWARNGNPEPHVHNGEDEFIVTLQNFIDQYNPQGMNFEWDYIFESNDRVVFSGWVNALYPTDDPEQLYRWRTRQVTVLTLQDSQVIHHRDFAGYESVEDGLVPAE